MNNQNLNRTDKIVNEDGTPTQYFMRLLLTRQNLLTDFEGAVQDAIDQVDTDKADKVTQVIADAPITGGGDLSADRHIGHANSGVTAATYGDAAHVPQIAVDAKGHVTGVTNVSISGGGGGGNWWMSPPLASDFPNSFGSNFTAVDDSDVGLMLFRTGGASSAVAGISKAIPVPSADWTVTIRMEIFTQPIGAMIFGLCTHNAAMNLFMLSGWDSRNFINLLRFNASAFDGVEQRISISGAQPIWHRQKYTASTGVIDYYISCDGKNWILHQTRNVKGSDFGTDPAYVGFCCYKDSYGPDVALTVSHWDDTF